MRAISCGGQGTPAPEECLFAGKARSYNGCRRFVYRSAPRVGASCGGAARRAKPQALATCAAKLVERRRKTDVSGRSLGEDR
jgi:hypothetical protein